MIQRTMTFTYATSEKQKPAELPASMAERVHLSETGYLLALQEIEKLTGLSKIKQTLRELSHFAAVQKYREKQGFQTPDLTLHMALLGNPGTGKTTVARLLADVFHKIGVLKENKFKEVSRVDLVGNYVGHTAKDTLSVLEQARGGLLYVDEAYALVRDNPNDFGMEAIETLLKFMEDHRNEIIVVFAGYREPMFKLLLSNPGLASRIPYQLHFPDYEVEELLDIAKTIAEEYDYRLMSDYLSAFAIILERERMSPVFANARYVRNRIESSIRKQNARIAREGFTEQELNNLRAVDL